MLGVNRINNLSKKCLKFRQVRVSIIYRCVFLLDEPLLINWVFRISFMHREICSRACDPLREIKLKLLHI